MPEDEIENLLKDISHSCRKIEMAAHLLKMTFDAAEDTGQKKVMPRSTAELLLKTIDHEKNMILRHLEQAEEV